MVERRNMKKQIIYPKFIPRLFSMTIDVVIVSIFLNWIMNIIHVYIQSYFSCTIMQDLFSGGYDPNKPEQILTLGEIISYLGGPGIGCIKSSLFANSLSILLMGTYFVFFWHKFGATPGKMIMRMKIVDADDHSKPTIYRCCKRFIGYITILIGVFRMAFSKNGQAMHDKMANTVVIKS
jgi:uncharacterized RDD family membrane protein YckC